MKLKFKILYTLICLFTASVAVAQDGLILTAKENKEWIENLKAEEELSQQLSSLKKRIVADTAVTYSSTRFICFTGLSDDKKEEIRANERKKAKKAKEKSGQQLQFRHRPLYQFVKDRESISLSGIKDGTAIDLQEFLTTQEVSSLEIFYDQPENVLYGVRGESGVILIKLKEEKTFERVKRLLL